MTDDPTSATPARAATGPTGAGADEAPAEASGRLAVGEAAPDFELSSGSGDIVRLSWLRGRTIVLYFYLRDRDETSIAHAKAFRDRYDAIRELEADVFGVGKDGHVSHEKMKLDHNLPFTLLVDHDNSVARRYGAWGERVEYGQTVEGVIRSHFVIGPEGTLLDVAYDVEPEVSVDRVMRALRETTTSRIPRLL